MQRLRNAFIHAVIWLILTACVFFLGEKTGWRDRLILTVPYGAINISLFYIGYFWMADDLVLKRSYMRAILKLIGLLALSTLLKCLLAFFFRDVVMRYGDHMEKWLTWLQYITSNIIVGVFFIFVSISLRMILNTYRHEKLRKTLETEKLNAELAFLKSQINPHFLFNSLNNIYSLAYQKSDKAPEAILKLSEIMRYMLHESQDNLVSVAEEINYLKNYMDLQRLRFREKVFVDLDIDIDREGYRIMPLLLISFLENAFKHGVATDPDHPIQISIVIKEGQLHFKANNRISKGNKDQTRGIGLANLRRRLELGYPGKHTLFTNETEDFYFSELFLTLGSSNE